MNSQTDAVNNLLAALRDMFVNTEYADGVATGFTLDHEAVESAMDQLLASMRGN